MNEATMFEWLLQLQPIGVALVLGFALRWLPGGSDAE
jgi:hypothetical protein